MPDDMIMQVVEFFAGHLYLAFVAIAAVVLFAAFEIVKYKRRCRHREEAKLAHAAHLEAQRKAAEEIRSMPKLHY